MHERRKMTTNKSLPITTLALLAGLSSSLLTGCKEAPVAEEPVRPEVATEPETAPPIEAPADVAIVVPPPVYDVTIVTATGVDLDPRLAALCNIPRNRVFFNFESTNLTASARSLLDEIATCTTTGPAKGIPLLVVGATDPRGSDAYNQQLGMSRAETVARYLTDQGLAEPRIELESVGETASVDAYGWPFDRRVTIRIAD